MPFGIICHSCQEVTPYHGSGELPEGWYAVETGQPYTVTSMLDSLIGGRKQTVEKPMFCSLKCLATWALLSQVVEEKA